MKKFESSSEEKLSPEAMEDLEDMDNFDDDCFAGYDVETESLPGLAYYHPSFEQGEKEVARACDVFIDAYEELSSTGYHNPEIAYVCGEDGLASCEDLSRYYALVRPIVVLGPAGSGKSSALNSLLSQSSVAFEHDGEDRGTYVIHEYRSMHPRQTQSCHVEVPYYTRPEIEKMVETHADDI